LLRFQQSAGLRDVDVDAVAGLQFDQPPEAVTCIQILTRADGDVDGLVDPRHAVTVNGHTVPLQPTGRVGEFVCGVRYRAWQAPSSLHPTIAPHAPLTIDLVDRWMQRSLGGGQYHVAHPGGRSYDSFPINAFEAESRRLGRFFTIGHTPGAMKVGLPVRSLEFPFTLDLRTT
ncbi:MAG: transglutaminase family protein, partial [Burkholderiales bacterium]|nr:transglutaminase family protein [Burkholderiales bacterium]